MSAEAAGTTFPTREAVDFVIVGSGASGGVLARELSRDGFKVVVLEQGPYRRSHEFDHDEFNVFYQNSMAGGMGSDYPQTFRETPDEEARPFTGAPPALYYHGVGGSSVHYSGNFWRFRPVDFKEHSLLGDIPGTGFADWPITYEELEPYYTKVDWEIGVSGAPGPHDPPRSKPYPLPPMPVKSAGVLFERGARRVGLTPQPAPVAILSAAYRGRAPCAHCGFCIGFGCEVGAKSSTLVTMIPEAEASGNCEIRPESTVFGFEHDPDGRLREVLYFDAGGAQHAQRAKAVVLAANGAETARLLLASTSAQHPDGLANSSGLVGKYLMFNGHSLTNGVFAEPLNEYKSIQCTRIALDFWDADEKRGFYGGGGLDSRGFLSALPITFGLAGLAPDAPRWGSEYKRQLAEVFTRKMVIVGNGTSLARATNTASLDPKLKDKFGRPALRITYQDHPDDLANVKFLQDRALEILEAAGARQAWGEPVVPQTLGAHLLGTCRMGDDRTTSVVDRYHRSHDVKNLFICDGSSFVTSGRGQPTMTIQALAFRAAEHIGRFARQGEI